MVISFSKKIGLIISAIVIASFTLLPSLSSRVSAISGSDFRADRIIDDAIFFDPTTMTGLDIQRFFESKVPTCDTNGSQPSGHSGYATRADWGTANGVSPPYTCLRDYVVNEPAKSPDAYCTGSITAGVKMAAQVIQDVGLACSINPKVLIVLLQKEQSLVTDDWPWPIQYRSATGYGCPDTAPCDAEYYGFFNQVYNAARQFQRYVKQSNLFSYQAGRSNYIQYNPNASCSGSNVFIQNPATAALYNYTPYQPNAAALANLYGSGDSCSAYGNRNFWRLFSDWFGSPLTDRCNYDNPGAVSTNELFHKYNRNIDTADFTIYAGTSTNCVESHVWNSGMQSWQTHIASNQPTISYPDLQVLYGDLDGSGYDYPVLFGVRNTSTGKIESHVWNRNMRSFLAHTVSNQAAIDPGDCKIILADLDARGKDDAYLICEQNTASGKIEIHKWNPGLQTWAWHTITNMTAVDPSQNTVVAGDINADGRDDLILVAYNHTGSGKVEFHVWNPGFWSWRSHIASNLPEIDQNKAKIEMADIDGNTVDEAVLVAFKNTGSSKIEFHIWEDGFGVWRSHIASNQPTP